jgi:hypothetical protein
MRRAINRRRFMQAALAASGGLLCDEAANLSAQPQEVHICPKSGPPAKVVNALRLTDLTTDSWDLRLTLSCLQGIVNRSQPRLYLIHDDYDELWLNWLRERGDVDAVQRLNLEQTFARFLSEVSQAFIIDPNVPATINVATMLASLRGGLVVTPRTADEYNLPAGRLPDSWKTGLDFRFMNWKKDVEAYRWFFQHYGDQLSKQAVAVLDPHEVALRDYLVEFRIPILWISGPQDVSSHPTASPEEEKQFAREVLMRWPPNIPCLGWPGSGDEPQGGIGEWLGVRLFSECAKFEVCTAYDGYSPTVGNLSVHSGTSASFRQHTPPVKLDRSKVYYSFVRSDGDGWNFQRHYYRKLFDEPAHGDVPLGWQIGPTAFDGMPDILDYYYKHAKPGDGFVNALTGVGYIHEDVYAANYPPEEQARILQDYVRLSALYRQRIDASVISTFAEMRPERLALFAEIQGLHGIFANYGRTRVTTNQNLLTVAAGIPVFRAVNEGPGIGMPVTPYTENNAVWFEVNDIKRWTPRERPLFLHVFLANWLTDMKMAERIAAGLGSNYVPVRPDQLVSLYRDYKGGG